MLILKGHKQPVFSITFSPDGRLLASAGRDRTVRLWDTGSGESIHTWDAHYPTAVDFSPDGRLLAVADSPAAYLLDVATRERLMVADYQLYSSHYQVQFSPDGQVLAIAGRRVGRIDVAARRMLPPWEESSNGNGCLAYTPDAAFLATGHAFRDPQSGLYDHTVLIRSAATGAERNRLRQCRQYITALAFAPDSRTLAACCGIWLRVWDASTGRELATHRIGRLHFQSVAFSPDGRLLATASNDQTARFWDTTAWQERLTFTWNVGRLLDVQFAPDGLRCAAGGSKGRIVIWDVDG